MEAIDNALKAIAEAEAIVRSARKYYGITRRSGVAGPRMRQFQARTAPVVDDGPDYFLTDRELGDAHAARGMLKLAKITRRAAFYRAAGLHLARLRGDWPKDTWQEIVHHEAGLRPSRAYQLIALANGKQSVEAQRQSARERKRKSRDKSTPPKTAVVKSPMIPMVEATAV